ncbi:YcdB/YcdC domain-containing protein [Gorillibacterium massiliense]|uniref:YcdB/YcdC domain-containing protein n=1 Tax=Gorillibacterium massiliense TaxID=1280390 RepID=UPI0004B9605B|nr:YcdB/YcdC domain-containing protein [Gorillibacterium massiliense]
MAVRKKILIAGLSTAFLLSGAGSAFADTSVTAKAVPVAVDGVASTTDAVSSDAATAKLSKDEALKRAKQQVDIPQDFKLNSSNLYYDSYRKYPTWSFNFSLEKDGNYYGSAYVTVEGNTGELLNFDLYDNDPAKKLEYPPKTDYAAAKQIAQKLLEKMDPQYVKSVVYNDTDEKNFRIPLQGDVRYSIRYDRVENGVSYPDNSIYFNIDGNGKLVGYNLNWFKDQKFASATPELKQDKALATYFEKNKPYLRYALVTPRGGKPEAVLSYNLNLAPIDANTGDLLTQYYLPVPTDLKTITEKPLAPKPAQGQNLTAEQAVDKVKAIYAIPADAVQTDRSYSEYSGNIPDETVPQWNLNWRVGKDGDPNTVFYNATVNASTGVVTNINHYLNGSVTDSKLTNSPLKKDQLQDKAVEFLKKVVPHMTNELIVSMQSEKSFDTRKFTSNDHYVNFDVRRVVNGVIVDWDNATVSMDVFTGEISSYWSSFSSFELPTSLPKTIGVDKAFELLMKDTALELQYSTYSSVSAYDEKMAIMIAAGKTTTEDQTAKLVYTPVRGYNDEGGVLDAATGQWRKSDTGEVFTPGKVTATDIQGHWAAIPLQLMLDYKALDVTDGKVYPDKAITKGEMIKMLVMAMNGGGYTPYYDASKHANSFSDVTGSSALFGYVEYAVDNGIIEKTGGTFNADAKLTREDLAELIVRALGYNKLSQKDGLFNLNVKDAAQITKKGQVAIVLSLGIMTASDGSFHAKDEVTRGMAAMSFYKYLQARLALQDVPLNYYGRM